MAESEIETSGGTPPGDGPEKQTSNLPLIVHPTQASGDDESLPLHVASRKSAPAINRHQDAISVCGVPFSFKGRSVGADERLSGPTSSPYPRGEGEFRMVIGVSEATTDVFPQYLVEARAQISGILKENCQPPVLALLVTNDNNAQHRQPEATSLNNITLPSDRPPLLDAEKSCNTIKTALEDSGIVVIPVTNRPKDYLRAVLTVLTTMDIPKSCELFWFLFTGHGSRGVFCLNDEVEHFEEVIQEASRIRIKYMAFFFECCQLHNEDKIKAAEIKKQYVALYSSPPNQVSYHYNGVGLMMIVLAKLLRKGYSGSLGELQRVVRHKLVKKMTKVLGIHEDMKEVFIAHHLPVTTSTMYDDFSFQRKISYAMRPVINAYLDHTAAISVYNPERILCHPSNSKFELVMDVVELRVGDQQERVRLAVQDASFGATVQMKVTLPPQAQQTSGELWVGCQYGDGRVEYCKPISVDLPCHGRPVIRMCTLEENRCEVAVTYDPNIAHPENDYYHVESVEIGYHDSSHSWCPLYHQDGYDFSQNVLVVLPPSHNPIRRELQVAVKYLKCPTPVFSIPCPVDQEPICSPKITAAVPNQDNFTATLTVRPELPALHTQSDLYVPKGYTVWSHVGSRSKVIVKKELKQGEKLEEEETVVVPLRLVRKDQIKSFKYVVAMKYNGISDVRSEEYPVQAGAIESPVITSVTLNGSYTADFKFMPNQPSQLLSDSDPDEYRVSHYDIHSQVRHYGWIRLATKEVEGGFLDTEESITVPLHLRSGGKRYCFKVTLHYSNAGDVESEEFSMECPPIAKPISAPRDVSLSYESWPSSGTTVTWKHDYTPPPDTSIASGLRYGVFKADEELLASVPINSKSVNIPVGCGPIRVGMYYSDHHELGCVYSDPIKADVGLLTRLLQVITGGSTGAHGVKKAPHHAAEINHINAEGEFALKLATRSDNFEAAKALIESGANVNLVNVYGTSALMVACKNGSIKLARLLLFHGAHTNLKDEQGRTALMCLCTNCKIPKLLFREVAQRLLKHGANINLRDNMGRSALLVACAENNSTAVDFLLSQKAEINVQDATGQSALMIACKNEQREIIDELLSSGIHIDMQDNEGKTALMKAMKEEIVRLLLCHGAQVNIQDKDGKTSLMIAYENGRLKVFEQLLKGGADIDVQDVAGKTTLMRACKEGDLQTVNLLLQYNVQVDVQDNRGRTAFMTACDNGFVDTADLLINSGADVNLRDKAGNSALAIATERSREFQKVTCLLVRSGAISDLQGGELGLTNLSHESEEYSQREPSANSFQEHVSSTIDQPPLIAASGCGDSSKVELLLSEGAEIDSRDSDGRTALIAASENGHTMVSDLLLRKGAYIDSQDDKGYSALMIACQNAHIQTTSYLLDEGADTFLKSSDGKNAFDIAVEINNTELIPLFTKIRRKPSYPGILFVDGTKRVTVTTEKMTVDLEEVGIHLSIPDNALSSTDPPLQLEIQPCFSGPFVVPQDIELVSPVYIVKPSRKVTFEKEVLVKIWHHANLESERDCEDMVFLSASTTPVFEEETPSYIFREIKGTKGFFNLGEEHLTGQIALKHFCDMALGKRRHTDSENEGEITKKRSKGDLYSARLYNATKPGKKVIFCVCLCQPLYIMYCNKVMARRYKSVDPIDCSNGVKINADVVCLTQTCAEGWTISYNKTPALITRDEINLQEKYEIKDLLEMDYPPKIEIIIRSIPVSPDCGPLRLHVEGLHLCPSFNILPADIDVILDTSKMKTRNVPSNSASVPPSSNPLVKKQTADICKCLYPLRAQWKIIGTFLSIDSDTLKAIKADSDDSADMLTDMISEWLRNCEPPPTCQALAEAVQQIDPSKAKEIRRIFS